MKITIEDVNAKAHPQWTGRCSISWTADGVRYRFWINLPSREPDGPLYKDPGNRILDPSRRRNAAMIKAVWEIIDRDRLIEKLVAEVEAAIAKDRQ